MSWPAILVFEVSATPPPASPELFDLQIEGVTKYTGYAFIYVCLALLPLEISDSYRLSDPLPIVIIGPPRSERA